MHKDWFKIKGYPHIGPQLSSKDRRWVETLVENPEWVSCYSFLPFIHKKLKVRKFRRAVINGIRTKQRVLNYKERELFYASHLDAVVYGYYANLLNTRYEHILEKSNFNECITAYRKINHPGTARNKCNVDFANEVFEYIRKANRPEIITITVDISKFFDSLDHSILKQKWKRVLECGTNLPPDHYNIFRNICKFSYVDEKDIFNLFSSRIECLTKGGNKKTRSITKKKYLIEKGAISFCSMDEIKELRNKNYIRSNKYTAADRTQIRNKGIPQGSPISAVLANIYMLDFDQQIHEMVDSAGFGLYRRYSDDMIVVTTPEHEQGILDALNSLIGLYKLQIQTDKTKVFHFKRDVDRISCFEKNSQGLSANTKLEYLGFSFDGSTTRLKSSSLSAFYRKMKRSIRRGAFYTNANNTDTKGKLFKTRLYKRFTYIGASRRRIYKRKAGSTSQWILTHRHDWGNFISYAQLAASQMSENGIKRQIRKCWRKFHEVLSRYTL